MKWDIRLKNFILYGNIWIALGAGAATVQTLHILGIRRLEIASFAALATFFTYNFQRLVKLDRLDGYADHNRNAWSVRNRRLMTLLTGLAFIFLLGFIPLLPRTAWALLAVAFVVSVGYVVRFIPAAHPSPKNKKTRPKRALRELPHAKLLLVAAVWSIATVLLPVLWTDARLQASTLAALVLERFFFIAALSVPFDIRDAELDQRSQQTLPQVFGLAGARNAGLLFIAVSGVFSLFLWMDGSYSTPIARAIALSQLLALTAVHFSITKDANGYHARPEPYYSGLLDGLIVLQAALVLAT